MNTARRFEDLLAWQRARALTRHIYCISRTERLARVFSLRDQMRRAAVSCMSNIAEGFARKGDKQFAHFLDIARGSAAEVQSLLYVASDEGLITDQHFEQLHSQADEVSALSGGLLKYLRRGASGV